MLTKRGDVVRVVFPNSDLVTSKRRPALVVQADNLNTGINQTLVAMISSNLARANHPSRVSVLLSSAEGAASGLRLDSVIMVDNIVTVRNEQIDSILGSLPDMMETDAALRHTLNL